LKLAASHGSSRRRAHAVSAAAVTTVSVTLADFFICPVRLTAC
jgi:hypothetical protein